MKVKSIIVLLVIVFCMFTMLITGCKHKEHDDEQTTEMTETEDEKGEDTEEVILIIDTPTSENESEEEPVEDSDTAEVVEVEKVEEPEEPTVEYPEEIPDETVETNNAETNLNLVSLGEFRLTAYCNCSKCCGKWAGGATASGVMPVANHTIAVDTSVIPFGTEIVIYGNTYVAEDTGSGIKGNCIDIYFNSHQEALNFGLQYAEVFKVVY